MATRLRPAASARPGGSSSSGLTPGAGTKPWRKSYRRRWRPESTFRLLSPLAKLVVLWVEENADDDGRTTTTARYLAAVLSGRGRGVQPLSHVTVWRAVQEAVRAGLLLAEVAPNPVQNLKHGPTTLTRVNFKQYQARPDQGETEPVTILQRRAEISSPGFRSSPSTPSLEGAAAEVEEPRRVFDLAEWHRQRDEELTRRYGNHDIDRGGDRGN